MLSCFPRFFAPPAICVWLGCLGVMTPAGAEWQPPFPDRTPTGDAGGEWELVDPYPAARFLAPVRLVPMPSHGEEMMAVVCKSGTIWSQNVAPGNNDSPQLILDISDRTQDAESNGMLGLAFHPEFGNPSSADGGFIYVRYAYSPDRSLGAGAGASAPSYQRLSRFDFDRETGMADPESELVYIQQFDRHAWHNGGDVIFDDDGFLYTFFGDEGGSYDSFDVAQKLDDRLFSGIVRIDIENDPTRSHPIRRQPRAISGRPDGWPASYTANYSIPDDNPWVDTSGGTLEEFWAYGLRSPHTAWLDRTNGKFWIGDVGQRAFEEVTVMGKGDNGQWPYREGLVAGAKSAPQDRLGTERPPSWVYGRQDGGCIIGGFLYSGGGFGGALDGKYLFADNNADWLRALDVTPSGEVTGSRHVTSVPHQAVRGSWEGPVSMAPGENGRVFVLQFNGPRSADGRILELVQGGASVPDPPGLLSQTGFFSDMNQQEAVDGPVAYEVVSALWSGGAEEKRWVWLPPTANSGPAGKIGFDPDSAYAFPEGSVLIKHFGFSDGAVPVETRFMVRTGDERWYGLSYRWRADGSDADLLGFEEEGTEANFQVVDGSGTRTQHWYFPSRRDCLQCHSDGAGATLGFRTHQLNFSPGGNENQLVSLSSKGIFDTQITPAMAETYSAGAGIEDFEATLEKRVLSYLDSNCSHCHSPAVGNGDFDARLTTPLLLKNLIGGAPVNAPGETPGEKIVAPGSPAQSLLHRYLVSDGSDQMPPLARNSIHQQASDLIGAWIAGLDPAEYPVSGVTYEYWEISDGVPYDVMPDIDNLVRQGSGISAGLDLGVRRQDDDFAVRFTGQFLARNSGVHQFFMSSEGAARIWVNGQTVIDDIRVHNSHQRQGSVWLDQGLHFFEVDYYLGSGIPVLDIDVARPDEVRDNIGAGDILRNSIPLGIPPVTDGMVSRLDASSLTGLDNFQEPALSYWEDESDAGNAATLVPGTSAPTLNVGFFPWGTAPAVRFTPGDSLELPALPLDGYSVFAVERYAGPSRERLITNSGSANWLFGFWDGSNAMYNGEFVGSTFGADTHWYLHSGTSGEVSEFYVDGLIAGAGGGDIVPEKITFNGWNPDERSHAEIAEFILYDRPLTTDERQEMERYLYAKWLDPLGSGIPGDEAPEALARAVFGASDPLDYFELPDGSPGLQFTYRPDIPNVHFQLEVSEDLEVWERADSAYSSEILESGRILTKFKLARGGGAAAPRIFARLGLSWIP